jgi:hypothetical protein
LAAKLVTNRAHTLHQADSVGERVERRDRTVDRDRLVCNGLQTIRAERGGRAEEGEVDSARELAHQAVTDKACRLGIFGAISDKLVREARVMMVSGRSLSPAIATAQ